MRFLWLCLAIASVLYAKWEKVTYPLTADPIDVVIPCSPKDLETLEMCLSGIRKYGEKIRRVIVLSKERLTDKAEWFDEAKYPFSKEQVALELFRGDARAAQEFLHLPDSRIGWIYQQLLKFYVFSTIPDLSPNVLVLDADVFFVRPISFIGERGAPLFATGREYTKEYFDHASCLLPDLKRVYAARSGIAHHMLFQKPILEDLLQKIAEHHQMEPWKAIVRCIEDKHGSALSEYEIYFNFVFLRTDQAIIRPLRSLNIVRMNLFSRYATNHRYDFLTCHSWSRGLPLHFMIFSDGE